LQPFFWWDLSQKRRSAIAVIHLSSSSKASMFFSIVFGTFLVNIY
jgi:hypothetical protein